MQPVDPAEKITSRNIPLPIQREVRQRCGFGCVVCGLPLYEYEHMEDWATVKRHIAAEITLLCDQHHREKTAGLLPKEVVLEANRSPHNFKTGVSKPYTLHFSGSQAEIDIGGNYFTCRDQGYGTQIIPVSIDNIPLLGFVIADNHLLLNLVVFNEYNRKILWIRNNQLVYSMDAWDISLIGTTLTIRERRGAILLEVVFAPPNKISVTRGRFLRNGIEIIVKPDVVTACRGKLVIKDNKANNCIGGIMLGLHENPMPGMLLMENISRYM